MSAEATNELKLSVVIPVYNERFLVRELVQRVLAVEIPGVREIEVVIVDDGSKDGTREILREIAAAHPEPIRYIEHAKNGGKGAAIRTGIAATTGDLIVFQDADLEYDPRDYARLVRPFLEDGADVVYGSRFLPSERRRVLYHRHALGNRFLTALSNWFTDLDLTDMETCYKMFRAPLLKSIPIRSNDFAMEPEITAKIAKRECRVFEVPISYLGRTYREGKKIGWKDGFKALRAMTKYWLMDDVYAEDEYGSHILHSLERAQRFNRWMAESIAPHVGARVLEIGAGIGNITSWLLPRDFYLASDINPHYLHYLRNFALGKPYLQVDRIDLEDPACFAPWQGRFDTVVCLNVLEHVRDPVLSLRNMASALEPGGRLVLYVPQGQQLYSSLDDVLGHRCRYSREMLAEELRATGFELESFRDFNHFAIPGWWLNGRLLKRRHFSRSQLKIFNILVPAIRRLDPYVPGRGLGLIAVARKS
ncbi:MAG TPA: bifunctional glycosyltransferase/class I SAM-dependent methyltransferase [Thermoanaerobaculia bacterium]|nr:bifunctional glycosyltransferase/class I SAM-dependent methyltransferase [Thermoanaerobaculia bacterium]